MRERALNYLRIALGQTEVDFRDGQWESIQAVLAQKRLLVVQRTGWGKSMVYFLATRLLRDQGAGVTLLISPLLSLMRNQLEAAKRIGVRAATINSTNKDDWDKIIQELTQDHIDLLLISPERLANDKFRQDVLVPIAARVGLLVIDEAHCISDWGHEFRPDYRRIVNVLKALPSNIPVLATTATANDRVVSDVASQLGAGIQIVRGPLVRKSLKLQNIEMPSPAARMAWLAQAIPGLDGSGIVYTLTQRDAERVAEWLRINEISAEAYHADVEGEDNGTSRREELEQKLLKNELKVLVSTVALGMGFDKPDLKFVIHFQRPASVVHYYQQVGRAGRAVNSAVGILMHGEEDDQISDFFISNAFPPQRHVEAILQALEKEDDGLSVHQLESLLNLKNSQLEKALKYMSVETPSPITKIKAKYHLTPAAQGYRVDNDLVAAITAIRKAEQQQMRDYMSHEGCLMEFLARELDDPAAAPCGKCAGCMGGPILDPDYNHDFANRASVFLRRSYQTLKPRKKWPSGSAMPIYGFSGNIGEALQALEGRALSLWRDAGWGRLVAIGKYETGRFDDELVSACVKMIETWKPDPTPAWVACIPSLNRPTLVPDFAERLAAALHLPFHACIQKARANPPQKEMQNSFKQANNLDGVFKVVPDTLLKGPCLLVDDMVDSRWTLTVAAALVRQAGCEAVFPLALALNSPRMD